MPLSSEKNKIKYNTSKKRKGQAKALVEKKITQCLFNNLPILISVFNEVNKVG